MLRNTGIAVAIGLLGLGTSAFCAISLAATPLACGSNAEVSAPRAGAKPNPEPLFRAIQEDLITTCGGASGSCHVGGKTAARWLAGPDAYASARAYPGIVPATGDVGDSTLLLQVDHEGPALKRFPKLYDNVAAWLSAELPSPPLPSSVKFQVVSGFNQVNLDTLGANLGGARLTFLASVVSTGTLSMTALRLYAPRAASLKIASPFFVVFPRDGKVRADPKVNGFSGEQEVPAGTSAPLFSGKMILTRYDDAGQLKVTFAALESTPSQSQSDTCRAFDTFVNSAAVAMRTELDITGDDANDGGIYDGSVIGRGSCVGCHARSAPPNEAPSAAVSAMDLRLIDSDPRGACAFARQYIAFDNKAQSLLLLNPTGQANPNHPIRPLAESDPIVTGLRAWVNAETP
jgi:hypothetical protein